MKNSRLIGGILLVAGTAIGAGMLALPVSTGLAGFYPSLLVFFLSWLFMTFTAFLLLEVSLWLEKDTDLISMADKTIGSAGKVVGGLSYLCLLYALIAAYTGGSARLLEEAFENYIIVSIPGYLAPCLITILFASCVFLGTRSVDYLNRVLMVGLIATYSLLVAFTPSHIELSYLQHKDWSYCLITLSIVVTSFGFHVIIPSLVAYLERDVLHLRRALFVGSILPLLVYVLWEFLVLGVVPLNGESGLISAWTKDLPATEPLKKVLGVAWLGAGARFFAFFSIATSFVGVSLSLYHFIADALTSGKTLWGRFLVTLLTFLPPLCFVLMGSRGFYMALEYAGIFVAVLLGILPVMMVWSGRYKKGMPSNYRVFGGKLCLIVAAVFFSLVIVAEVSNKLGYLQFISKGYL